MVFSQTSHKTHSILKVVDIDRLKADKEQELNCATGVVIGDNQQVTSPSPTPTTSFSEEYLKPEPLNDGTMFHDSDCEFFQDLVQWCSAPAKEELVQTIDSTKITEERAHNTNTQHTLLSPQGWDVFVGNSTHHAQADFYNTTPIDPLSPSVESFTQYDRKISAPELLQEQKNQFQEQFLDISSLPVVIGELSPEPTDMFSWQVPEPVEWVNTHDTNYTDINTTPHYTMPLIDQEDSLDLELVSVIPREVESNNVVISQYIVNEDQSMQDIGLQKRGGGLSVDVASRAPLWFNDVISTPEVLSYVEQLEKEKCTNPIMKTPQTNPTEDLINISNNTSFMTDISAPVDYEPITPKSESHIESENDDVKPQANKRKRHNSEDSDETYTPYSDHTPRKYTRRKPNVPIKDMILALEGSQQLTKARRGRPPKRRESNVSSVCSIDDNNSSASTHEYKYRELRDKNNEASKRSRMNRKLKELQVEQLANDLEERNKKLKVKADILEDMKKKLKEALMAAILQK